MKRNVQFLVHDVADSCVEYSICKMNGTVLYLHHRALGSYTLSRVYRIKLYDFCAGLNKITHFL